LFAPGSNRPEAESGPDNAQRVATIKNTNASPEGPVLTVADKDGDRKITIGPDTAIWIARAARITDIKVGAAVTMSGVKREDGSLQVLRATVGPAGAGDAEMKNIVLADATARDQAIRHYFGRALREAREDPRSTNFRLRV
jgi:hypothetical protein